MGRRWVCDASPLIALSKTGHADLFVALAEELVIPEAVAEEIRAGAEDDPARSWLVANGERYVKPSVLVDPTIAAWDLGRGEGAVLSWAYQLGGWEAIVDDRAARHCAQAHSIPVRGTIGVILLAKKERRIERIEPILTELVRIGARVDEGIIKAALRLAAE